MNWCYGPVSFFGYLKNVFPPTQWICWMTSCIVFWRQYTSVWFSTDTKTSKHCVHVCCSFKQLQKRCFKQLWVASSACQCDCYNDLEIIKSEPKILFVFLSFFFYCAFWPFTDKVTKVLLWRSFILYPLCYSIKLHCHSTRVWHRVSLHLRKNVQIFTVVSEPLTIIMKPTKDLQNDNTVLPPAYSTPLLC